MQQSATVYVIPEENVACWHWLLMKSAIIKWTVRPIYNDKVRLDHKAALAINSGPAAVTPCYLIVPLQSWVVGLIWQYRYFVCHSFWMLITVTFWALFCTQCLLPGSGGCILLVYAGRLICSLIRFLLAEQTDLEAIWYFLQLQSVTLWHLPRPLYIVPTSTILAVSPFCGEATVLAHKTSKATECNCIKWIW